MSGPSSCVELKELIFEFNLYGHTSYNFFLNSNSKSIQKQNKYKRKSLIMGRTDISDQFNF